MTSVRTRSRLSTRTLVAAGLLLLTASCTATHHPDISSRPPGRPRPSIDLAVLEQKVHELVNRKRDMHGLIPLAWDESLARIARSHSKDMAKRGFFSHSSPEGTEFTERYRAQGYSCQVPVGTTIHLGAENIALDHFYRSVTKIDGVPYYDWNTAEQIAETTVRGWMNSPGHRKNILTPYWRREGIGVHLSPDDKVLITQNFC